MKQEEIPGKTGLDLHHLYKKATFNADCQSFQLPLRGLHPTQEQPGEHTADMDILGDVSDGFGIADSGLSIGSRFAKLLPTHRECTVHLQNDSSNYTLCNPRVYSKSGRCTVPLPPSIRPSLSAEGLFVKKPRTTQGAVGLVTYDLLHISTKISSKKIAVLFQVPFDLKAKSRMYAVGIFDIDKECDSELFLEMSKNTSEAFVRGKAKGPSLSHKIENVTIMATMSNCNSSVVKVQVCDD